MQKYWMSFVLLFVGLFWISCQRSVPKVDFSSPEAYEQSLMAIERAYTVKLPIPTEVNLDVSPHQNVSPPSYHVNTPIKFVAKLKTELRVPMDPDGKMTFFQNDVPVCENIPLNLKTMTGACTFTPVEPGIHVLSVKYKEKANLYAKSVSYLIYSVEKYQSTVELDVRDEKKEYKTDSKVVLFAQTKTAKGSELLNMTGTLKFFINGQPIDECGNVSVASGICNYTVENNDAILNMGVEYSGDDNFQPSVSHLTLPYRDTLNIQLMSNDDVNTPLIKTSELEKSQNATVYYDENVSKNGATLKFRIIPLSSSMQVSDLIAQSDFKIQSIFSAEDELLETQNLQFSDEEYKDVECRLFSVAEGILQAECKGFRPIVNNFTLTAALVKKSSSTSQYQAVLANQRLLFSVERKNITPTTMTETVVPANGCGLQGTTRQRIFDCSMKVENFGKRLNINLMKPVHYKKGDLSEIYWFLVNCPAGKDVVPGQCAWLSPVMHKWNVVLKAGQYDANGNSMKNYADSRLLWSGSFFKDGKSRHYTFKDANGAKPEIADYTQYPYIDQSTQAKRKGTNQTSTTDLCSTAGSQFLFSKVDPYNWQIPSYPMALTLTGGPYCSRGGRGYTGDWQAFCNGGNKGQGFNAANTVFGFNDFYWTSNVDAQYKIAWIFNGVGELYQDAGGGIDNDILDNINAVRCVTPKW